MCSDIRVLIRTTKTVQIFIAATIISTETLIRWISVVLGSRNYGPPPLDILNVAVFSGETINLVNKLCNYWLQLFLQ